MSVIRPFRGLRPRPDGAHEVASPPYDVLSSDEARGLWSLRSMLMSWRHSGFNVFCGLGIYPRDETAMENLARYIVRASFSQERMSYVVEEAQVLYR